MVIESARFYSEQTIGDLYQTPHSLICGRYFYLVPLSLDFNRRLKALSIK